MTLFVVSIQLIILVPVFGVVLYPVHPLPAISGATLLSVDQPL